VHFELTMEQTRLEGQPDINSLFPTPLISSRLADAEAINPGLAALIHERAATHPSVSRSNSGGWQSGDDFADWSGERGAAVLGGARELADSCTAVFHEDQLVRPEIPWRLNAWANLNRTGDSNEAHSHPGSFWSGVYYVDAGEPDCGGELELFDPRGVVPNMYAPWLKMAVTGCVAAGLATLVQPRTGHFLLFPSWLLHAVRPYRGARARLSIAFNFCL
jgi:uncharacterized protein (TIGR02466 family)